MTILESIIERIDRFYTEPTRREFQERLIRAGLDSALNVPLMRNSPVRLQPLKSLQEIRFDEMNSLRLENNTSTTISLSGVANFAKATNVEELFRQFIAIAHHYVRLQHFRELPEYYAPVLSGNRYFFFHGDGFCCQLAVLFQGLCRAVLDREVSAMYCRTPSFDFSHGYCLYRENGTTFYVDPDLKAMFNYDQLPYFEPATWFVNFIENINIRMFFDLPQTTREWMFSKVTREYFDWLLSCCLRELSQPGSRYAITYQLFHDTIPNCSEIYDVCANDYPWKEKYRQVAKGVKETEGHYIMHNLVKPVTFALPPGATFEVNPQYSPLRFELDFLSQLFFGRIPGCLEIPLTANTELEVLFPELPWLLAIDEDIDTLQINDKPLALHFSASRECRVLGLGDLDEFFPTLVNTQAFRIRSGKDTILKVFLPLNASFWNSPNVALKSNDELTVKWSADLSS